MLAEGPRQVLNAITLYSVAEAKNFTFDISVYQQEFSTLQGVILSFMLLTVAIWALSFIRLLVAAILYLPLVCHIRGNLKEYCCHKVDKRISQLLIERRRKRADQKPETNPEPDANSRDSGKFQPTLPKVELDGDGESVISMPLYPLSRTETADSRRGLLSRTESTSTIETQGYLARTNTIGTEILSRTTTNASNGRGLTRTDTNVSNNPYDHSRSDSIGSDHPRSLSRGGSDGRSFSPAPMRRPTLPHLVGDFSIPEVSHPAPSRTPSRFDTRGPPPSRSGTASPRPGQGYGPPSRSQSRQEQGFGPPPRSNTNPSMMPTHYEQGFRPPPRSNTNQPMSMRAEQGFGPPPRSNTFAGMNAGPRRPERPFNPNPSGYM